MLLAYPVFDIYFPHDCGGCSLLICKMPLFDSVVNAFGTAGTGGFGIKNTSIGAYSSPAIDIVIAVFQNSPVCLYADGQT